MCASYLMLRCASLKVDAALSVGRSGLGSTLYYQEVGKGSVAVAWIKGEAGTGLLRTEAVKGEVVWRKCRAGASCVTH